MNHNYDAIVVGAGYIGCSAAYYLSKAGVKTALLEQHQIAAGATRANYGNIQIQDCELNFSIPMIKRGSTYFDHLEEELGNSTGFKKIGSLLVIENEDQWNIMAERQKILQKVGIPAELVASEYLSELEPILNTKNLRGALYNPHEAQVYPFGLVWSYIRKAKQLGLSIHTSTEVTGLIIENGHLKGVNTNRGDFFSDTVILTTGAWTNKLGKTIGYNWEIPYIRGQAIITEAVPRAIHSHLTSAVFFEEAHGEPSPTSNKDTAVMAFSQSPHGHFLLGESSSPIPDFNTKTTPGAPLAIANEAKRYLPALENLRVLRSWAALVASTHDGLPFFGPVKNLPGLILATAFRSTVIVTPLAGDLIAQLVTQNCCDLDISNFSPDRTFKHENK